MRFPRASLKQKLILGVALVHAVLMVGFIVDLLDRQQTFLTAQSAAETQSLARALAAGSAAAVLAHDVVGMEELVAELSTYPEVEYALLLDRDGQVLAHSDRSLVGQYALDTVSQGLSTGPEESRLLVNDARRVDAAAPVFSGTRLIAWARVARNQSLLGQARDRTLQEGLTYAALAVLIGTVFAWMLGAGVTRELARLLRATRRVRVGEREVSVATDRTDELGDLSRAFGEMTLALRDRERALEESERRWLMALDGAGHGVWDWNATTDRVFYSRAWKEMFGYGEEDVSGTLADWMNRVHPDDLPACTAAWDAHFAGTAPSYRSVHRLRAKDGSHRWVLDQGMAFERAPDGRPLRVVGTHTDITAQRHAEGESDRLQRELDQAHKMEALGQLTGGVAHDFNNILAIIMSNAELARCQSQDETVRESLKDALLASKRARDLVTKMLAYSRRTPTTLESMDPGAPISEALRMLRASLPATTELISHLEPVREVRAGTVDLQQLVMNLVINARDAVGEHGRIEVGLREVTGQGEECALCMGLIRGEFVELSVTDDGHGMAPELLPRIFDPFFTTKPAGEGTGMGLSVVQGIMRTMEGHVHLTSRPGLGTTLRLLFPLSGTQSPVPVTTPTPVSAIPKAGGHVLVVDDEPMLGRALARSFKARGYEVTVFTDPRAALLAFDTDPARFSALITDETMPGLTGLDLSENVLKLRPELPIFLCTGNSGLVDLERLKRLGVRRMFQKPVDPGELFAAIDEACHTNALPLPLGGEGRGEGFQ